MPTKNQDVTLLRTLLAGTRNSAVAPFLRAPAPGASPSTGVPANGVGLRVTPALRTRVALPDWLERQVASQPDGAELRETLLRSAITPVIHWPTVLRSAFSSDLEPGMVKHPGRRLFARLRGFLRVEAPLLVDYLDRLERLGRLPEEELEAARVQTDRLFAGPLAPRILASFAIALEPVADVPGAQALRTCQPCLSRRAGLRRQGLDEATGPDVWNPCSDCAARIGFAAECSTVELQHLFENAPGLAYAGALTKRIPRVIVKPARRVARDLERMLSAMTLFEGAQRQGHWLVVDWETYGRRLAERFEGVPEPEWTAVAAQVTCVDMQEGRARIRETLASPPDEPSNAAWELGLQVQAKLARELRAFGTELEDRSREPSRVLAEGQRPAASAVRWSKALTVLGNLTSMVVAVKHRRRLAALRAACAASAGRPRKRKTLPVEFVFPTERFTGQIRRTGESMMLAAPFPLPEGVRLPSRILSQQRSRFDEASPIWWRLSELEAYQRELERSGRSEAALVERIAGQFSADCERFRKNPAAFKAALRSEAVEQRGREAVSTGKVVRLGPLTTREREELEAFLHRRDAEPSDQPFRGPLTAVEWQRLHHLLPGRSKLTISRAILQMGLAHAKRVGYVAYLRSGFCSFKSARQRAAWLAQGVKL